LTQPREQRVAGKVAEGVVVVLEAIEIEEQQHRRRAGVAADGALEIGDQPAAIGKAGQRIARGRRLEIAPRAAQGRSGERHEDQRHGEHRHRRGADAAQQTGGGIGGGGHHDPVVGVAQTRAQVAIRGDMPIDRRHAGAAPSGALPFWGREPSITTRPVVASTTRTS
jgi:hypothetical protein